jgi:hypothetical protein
MLFGKKERPAIIGGATPLFGEKYDLPRVLYAYEQLFDALTAKFGKGTSKVKGRAAAIADGVDWPHPGKDKVIETWKFWSQNYDVLGEGVHHAIGPVKASAFVLAKNWSVFDATKGTHTISNGQPLEALNTGPQVAIYGRTQGSTLVGMNEYLAEKVRAVVVSDLARFGFVYTTASYSRVPNVIEIVASVSFPHSIYGAGEDWLRVRCVQPNGSEVESAIGGN